MFGADAPNEPTCEWIGDDADERNEGHVDEDVADSVVQHVEVDRDEDTNEAERKVAQHGTDIEFAEFVKADAAPEFVAKKSL